MRRHRPQQQIEVKHERWMVSYADFITLLFAFFVVMYSISQLNEAKYKELSTSLNAIFTSPPRNPNPIALNERSAMPSAVVDQSAQSTLAGTPAIVADLSQLESQLTSEFADLIDDELVELDSNELWLELKLNSNVLFASASAEPSDAAKELFGQLATKLRGYENQIQIEGYTDNQAIRSPRFASNWELSSARAATVVKLLIASGVRPQRLSAVGYGEFQPIADNDTVAGRQQNRRVVVMVSRRAPERMSVSARTAMEMAAKEPNAFQSQSEISRAASRASAIAEMRQMAEQRLLQELEAEAAAQAEEELPPLILQPQATESGGVLYSNGDSQ
ncbi:flagellar motor protein MotD [Pseudoteredinibacter isoporae]|uniref:Chemotaxis protein MotB n=1 Tax=Pseudoteredinibacter isoporae TaxID=570281 RepID=A0A7X0JWC7_9GAMM|nr:flagellar motor protein MotD [Pseudoteredinibacter isoporae]MBB6523449.1 chemotaxis protein MotB [Pseudoteredinibacter isoporae]NHO88958.1 flagellar motor protein MotD [Pseudoteredinibacter isoporae]NIB24334.1 flagellar motor protein MotD [Pseudoteredinibacter isoporae]